MSNNPFAHSHALHVDIPASAAESIPQTPSERTGPQSASFTNPDVVLGPGSGSENSRVQHDADSDRVQTHALNVGHGHALARSSQVPGHSHALAMVPSTPVQPGMEGAPSTPISPRPSRRATRRGSQFSVVEDHEEGNGDRKGDFIAEAAMLLGVMAGHFVAGYMGHVHEEPSSEQDGHDGDEKEDA